MSERANKMKLLQEQFICPIWGVWFGSSVRIYYTSYHAEQFVKALRINGTPCTCFNGKGELV